MSQQIEFYTDGSLKSPPKKKGWGMMGVGIVGLCGPHKKEWSLSLGPGTCQLAEILAVREALKVLGDRPGTDVTIYSDSSYAIGVLFEGNRIKAHREVIEETLDLIEECASFRMEHVTGHSGNEFNEFAHKLAGRAASIQDLADLPPPPAQPLTVTEQLRGVAEQIVFGEPRSIYSPEVQEACIERGPDLDLLERQVAELQVLVGMMTAALRFYADPINWQRRPELVDRQTGQPVPVIVLDKGFTARQALLQNGIPIAVDPYEDPEEISKQRADG